jgi:hypothetical protein
MVALQRDSNSAVGRAAERYDILGTVRCRERRVHGPMQQNITSKDSGTQEYRSTSNRSLARYNPRTNHIIPLWISAIHNYHLLCPLPPRPKHPPASPRSRRRRNLSFRRRSPFTSRRSRHPRGLAHSFSDHTRFPYNCCLGARVRVLTTLTGGSTTSRGLWRHRRWCHSSCASSFPSYAAHIRVLLACRA